MILSEVVNVALSPTGYAESAIQAVKMETQLWILGGTLSFVLMALLGIFTFVAKDLIKQVKELVTDNHRQNVTMAGVFEQIKTLFNDYQSHGDRMGEQDKRMDKQDDRIDGQDKRIRKIEIRCRHIKPEDVDL